MSYLKFIFTLSIHAVITNKYGGTHVSQLARQGVCKLSIKAPGGGGPSSC